jgi:hypothetical protein
LTLAASATLTRVRLAHTTVVEALAWIAAMLVPWTLAVLLYALQEADVVELTTCTDVLAPAARLVGV